MSLSNAQIIGVGSVAFMALTYRNLDLKYTMNVSRFSTSLGVNE